LANVSACRAINRPSTDMVTSSPVSESTTFSETPSPISRTRSFCVIVIFTVIPGVVSPSQGEILYSNTGFQQNCWKPVGLKVFTRQWKPVLQLRQK